jgi:DNA ligase-1
VEEKPFIKLCELCEKIENTSSRNAKVGLITSFLRELKSSEEISSAIKLIIGKPLMGSENLALGVGYGQLLKLIMEVANISEKDFLTEFNKTGDFGETVRRIFMEHQAKTQRLLTENQVLTISEIVKIIKETAEISGFKATVRKLRNIENHLRRLSPLEAKYFVKNLIGEMRHGVSEALIEESLAAAFNIDIENVRLSHMATGDLGKVGEILKIEGVAGLKKLSIKPFNPIKPMLAEQAESLIDIFKEHGKQTCLEFKLDGARVQLHKTASQIKIFSRRLTDVTVSLPEIVETASKEILGENFILDGEVVAVNHHGKFLPFQEVMKRYRRIIKVEDFIRQIPTKIFLFDALYLNGEPLIGKPLLERRRILEEIAPRELLVPHKKISSISEAEKFFKEALEAGCEGIMAKNPASLYLPGKRGKRWLKLKRKPDVLDLVIVAAEYGYGYRYRWLSDYYLAVINDEKWKNEGKPENISDYIERVHGGKFRIVGKTFKGLTNLEIENLTRKLKSIEIETIGRTVIVKPEIVVEVGFSNIQPSPQYSCGYALRFARILKIRDDKKPEEADSLSRLKQLV